MREIKFRAWKFNSMVYDVWPTGQNKIGRWIKTFNKDEIDFVEGGGTQVNIMQYTGLHDKNGKEIYEGDIIAYYDADDGKNRVGILEFEDLSDVPDWIIWSNKEVIGNIYENSELLEN